VIFTTNATAGIKLVGEAFPWTRRSASSSKPASKMTILREAHTSLVGLRGLVHDDKEGQIELETITQQQLEQRLSQAQAKGHHHHCSTTSQHPSPPPSPSFSISNLVTNSSSQSTDASELVEPTYNLFAYPAQCNFGGRRFPLSWAAQIKDRLDTSKSKTLVLLDAASYAMTSELDLSNHAISPDFVVVSFYKMFGFPTGHRPRSDDCKDRVGTQADKEILWWRDSLGNCIR